MSRAPCDTTKRMRYASLLLIAAGSLCAENWPYFRGPGRQGVSSEPVVPVTWSATENIAWKTEIPGEGWSSPVVWGNRVFVTAATEGGASARVMALDRDSGRILWNTEAFKQEVRHKQKKNSYASPTPATDGRMVYVAFNDGGIAALDFAGKVKWTYREVKHYSEHGLGASPVLHNDLLIMVYDPSSEGPDKKVGWKIAWDKALVLALDKRTGKVRWQGKRGLSRLAHVTPNVQVEGGQAQLISAAGDVIQAHDLSGGDLLWTVRAKGEGVVPAVVIGEGMAFVSSGFEESTIRAVRRGEVVWEQTKAVPHIPSFLYAKPWLFTVTETGIAMCLRAATGEVVWQERLGGEYSASPVWANGKLYFLSESGETVIVEAGQEFKVVGRNALNEKCQASPAISGGRIFIRGERNLYAIGGGK